MVGQKSGLDVRPASNASHLLVSRPSKACLALPKLFHASFSSSFITFFPFPSASLHDILLTLVSGPRIRRIKCDESKPFCVKCTSTGRTCDGYAIAHNTPLDPPAGSQLVPFWAQSIPDELSIGIDGDHAELRGFHFFQSYVWPQLSSELRSVFWERLILQASHADAAMRHAAIAFGSMGERLLINNVMTYDNEDANRLHNFACLQYYKAIKELRKQLSSGQERSIELTLMTCFIFICFEFLQGNENAAFTHLKSGIEIIRHSDFQGIQVDLNNPSMPLMESVDFGYHVTIIFAIFDRAAAIWIAAPSFGMPTTIAPDLDYRSLFSDGFPNLGKADEYLENLCNHLHRILPTWAFVPNDSNKLPKPRPTTIPSVEGLFATLGNWSRAMDAFMARSRHILSDNELQKATCMILQHRIANLRLNASCHESEEEFYRDSEPTFKDIVSISTHLLQRDDSIDFRGSGDERRRGLFTFDTSLIQSLFFTATHCQNPDIQEKALSLLSTSPWREGGWDSATMARIAERRIWQREQDLSDNGLQSVWYLTAGLDMTGYDLQRRQYQVGGGGSFKVPEDRIIELGDSDLSF